jgi:hypothetical protein
VGTDEPSEAAMKAMLQLYWTLLDSSTKARGSLRPQCVKKTQA